MADATITATVARVSRSARPGDPPELQRDLERPLGLRNPPERRRARTPDRTRRSSRASSPRARRSRSRGRTRTRARGSARRTPRPRSRRARRRSRRSASGCSTPPTFSPRLRPAVHFGALRFAFRGRDRCPRRPAPVSLLAGQEGFEPQPAVLRPLLYRSSYWPISGGGSTSSPCAPRACGSAGSTWRARACPASSSCSSWS